jgi:hypothetical protein
MGILKWVFGPLAMAISVCSAQVNTIVIEAPLEPTAIELNNHSPMPSWDNESIVRYVASEAIEVGVSVPLALFIVEHESQFDPTRTGDTDKVCPPDSLLPGQVMHARGLWQSVDCWHITELPNAAAYDVVSSTAWALPELKRHPQTWSTYMGYNK